jgi:CheY-specific phosphatase CheX
MPQTLTTLTTPDALEAQISVTQQVFEIMAGIAVYPSTRALSQADPCVESVLRYLVVCKGSIVLESSASVAFGFTERMMSVPTPTWCDDDVKDAMGELVNMIGGNLKGLLPIETELSSPIVFEKPPLEMAHSRPGRLSRTDFDCEFGLFRLSLYGNV